MDPLGIASEGKSMQGGRPVLGIACIAHGAGPGDQYLADVRHARTKLHHALDAGHTNTAATLVGWPQWTTRALI